MSKRIPSPGSPKSDNSNAEGFREGDINYTCIQHTSNQLATDFFRFLGTKIAEYPVRILVLVLAVDLLLFAGLGLIEKEIELDELWTQKGGRLEVETNYGNEYSNSSKEALNQVVLTNAGNDADGNPKDVLNRDVLREHLRVLDAIRTFKVQKFNVTWEFKDLCDKIPLPQDLVELVENSVTGITVEDIRNILPCNRPSVLDCFAEGKFDFLAMCPDECPLQSDEDATLKIMLQFYPPLETEYGLSGFDHLPSFMDPNVDIHHVVSNGCRGWLTFQEAMHWPDHLILGGVKRTPYNADNTPAGDPKLTEDDCAIQGEQGEGVERWARFKEGKANGCPTGGKVERGRMTSAVAMQTVLRLAGPYWLAKESPKALKNRLSMQQMEEVTEAWMDGIAPFIDRLNENSNVDGYDEAVFYPNGTNYCINTTLRKKSYLCDTCGNDYEWDQGCFDQCKLHFNLTDENCTDHGTVMRQFPAGPDPFTGNWWYMGEPASIKGKTGPPSLQDRPLTLGMTKMDRLAALDHEQIPFPKARVASTTIYTSNAFDKVVEDATKVEWPLLGTSILLITLFVAIVSMDFDGYRPKLGLLPVGMIGLLLVILSMCSAVGLYSLCGYRVNAAVLQAMPFLSLGLGVDDLFLVLHTYRMVDMADKESRIGQCFKKAGLSVTLTSLCNLVGFLFGTLINIPALKTFCFSAAFAVICNYFTLMFALPALFSIFFRKGQSIAGGDASIFTKLAAKLYTKVFANWKGKAAICLVVVIMLSLSAFGVTQMKDGIQAADVVPKDGMLHEFLTYNQEHFRLQPLSVVIMGADVVDEDGFAVTYESPETQRGMDLLRRELATHPDVSNLKTTWFKTFKDWLYTGAAKESTRDQSMELQPDGDIRQDMYYAWYRIWKSNKAMSYIDAYAEGALGFGWFHPAESQVETREERVMLRERCAREENPEPCELAYTYYSMWLEGVSTSDTEKCLETIKSIRKITDKFSEGKWEDGTPGSKPKIFCYPDSAMFRFWEQYIGLRKAFWTTFGACIASIFFVSLIMLGSPISALCVCVACAVIGFEIYGMLSYWDVAFSAFPAITIIASIGLSIEFTAHLCASFEFASGSRNARMASCVKDAFAPTAHGAISSFLAYAMLAFSELEFVVKYFFIVNVSVIVIGYINSFCLPVILSLIGPGPRYMHRDTSGIEPDGHVENEEGENDMGEPFRYTGQTLNGEPHGKGVKFWYNLNEKYEGEFREGQYAGYGVYTWKEGHMYLGQYAHSQRDGHGVYQSTDGQMLAGLWKRDVPHGPSVFTLPTDASGGKRRFYEVYQNGDEISSVVYESYDTDHSTIFREARLAQEAAWAAKAEI